MPSPYNYFSEQLAVVSKTLEVLNREEIPEDSLGGFHIRVQLADEDGNIVGIFSDEIGPGSWYYQPLGAPYKAEPFGKGITA